MKIGIITLNGYFNYGNRLQNYALQQVLIKKGYEVETVIFEFEKENKYLKSASKKKLSLVERLYNMRKKSICDIANKCIQLSLNKVNNKRYQDLKEQREGLFKDFTTKYIRERRVKIINNQIPNSILREYDFFITGSDQVWNPNYIEDLSINFLTFFNKERSIAYAPSFGVSSIPEQYIIDYKSWIAEIDHLSVREHAGAKIIKELTGRSVPVLVDPTLLLEKEEWGKITKNVNIKLEEKYVLTYFLGETRVKYRKTVEKYAKDNNLVVINLADITKKKEFISGPSEFLYYIMNCSLFCTDSFHGAVFSILFKKPFVVFERLGTSSMYSRINTLLDKFDLNSRKFENINSNDDLLKIEYSHVDAMVEKERIQALNFLGESLMIKDEY